MTSSRYRWSRPAGHPEFGKPLDRRKVSVFAETFGAPMTAQTGMFAELLGWYWNRYQTYRDLYARVPIYNRTLRQTHFDFVNDLSVNAVATKNRDVYLIGMHLGAVINIQILFELLLSHPEVLPQFGDTREEKESFSSLADCDWTRPLADVLASVSIDGKTHIGPRHQSRKNVAAALGMFALDFLFFHEMGHVCNNHVDLYLARGRRELSEVAEADKRTESLDDAALELNADNHAVGVTVLPWFGSQFPGGSNYVFSTPRDGLVAWTVAIGFLFLVLDRRPTRLREYRHRSHPHPLVRLVNVSLSSMQMAGAYSAEAAEMANDTWGEAIDVFGRAVQTVDFSSAMWHALQSELDDAFEEFSSLADHLQPLFRQLEGFGPGPFGNLVEVARTKGREDRDAGD